MSHFFVSVDDGKKNIISQKIVKIDSNTDTFKELYDVITKDLVSITRSVHVYVGKIDNKWIYVEEGLYDEISLMSELELKHIRFVIQPEEDNGESSSRNQEIQQNQTNIFDTMMQRAHQPYFPMQKREDTQRDTLYNDVISLLRKNQKYGWSGVNSESIAKKFVDRLVALLWYIDPHWEKLISRSLKLPDIFNELEQYQCNENYNKFYFTGHHKKEQLSREKIEQLVKSLESSIEQPWASEDKWMDFIIQVLLLIESIKKYISYLQEVNQKMNTIHYSDVSTRNPGCDLKVYTIEVSDSIHSKYEELSNFLLEKDSYEFFDLDEYTPYDVIQKYNYIKNLQLNVPVTIYRYYQGNYLGTVNYIWKVPVRSDHRSETENARIIAAINENLPKYYTRQMRKNALKKYSLFKKVTPVVLRTLYFDLTGDASTTNNVISKEIEERLRIMMQLEDPSIIVDLRTNNGFKGKEFNCFWDEMGAYFNENTPAVDDRRQQEILYMPIAISIRDLREIILYRLEAKYGVPLPCNISIPSIEWIRLQFWPTNPTSTRAMHYTGLFNIKYQVQARQLRKDHPDAHYCACLFRYLREFAILYRNYVCFIAADDKHKVPIGEGVATSTGVRNKKSLVSTNSTLVASDHDFTKLSLTPSVIFLIDVPTTIEESFYHGNVFVSYKDTIFQPSNAIRHATEFFNVIQMHYISTIPPILCLYTDGGPDHRTTFGSVQISLICLFLRGDFDMLIALRTAPYHSWANPAERIMSIINLGLQGVAIMRDMMNIELEDIFKKADTLEEIRAAANKSEDLKNGLRDCILNIQQLLHSRTERLVLHENLFRCYDPASNHDIDNFFKIILEIDKSLNVSETTAEILSKKKDLQEFLKSHCRIRHYSFQIKKCNNVNCNICKPVRLPQHIFENINFLPDPIPSKSNSDCYEEFKTVYNTETTEKFRPTLIVAMENTERAPPSILTNTKVRDIIQCFQCGKFRCLYSEKALTATQKSEFQYIINDWDYSCGSPLVPEDHALYNILFVREKITCESPIELAYYSSRKNYISVCYWCGYEQGLVDIPTHISSKYKFVFPLCNICQAAGKEFFKRIEIKTNTRKRKGNDL